MEIRTWGPLEVLYVVEPVALGGRKQRALLAVLALSLGRAVLAARLIDDLWGEEAPDTRPRWCRSTSRSCARCCHPTSC